MIRAKDEIMEDYADECFYRRTHFEPDVTPTDFFNITLSAEEQALYGTAEAFESAVAESKADGWE